MLSQDVLQCFHDRPIVRVTIPTRREGRLALDASVQTLSPPYLHLEFHPEQFPSDDVAAQGEWTLVCDQGGQVISVRARLDQILDDRRVRLKISGSTAHEVSRGFHRIDAEVYLKYWPVDGEGDAGERMVRQRVNISGCGLRWRAERPLEKDQRMGLEIVLPGSLLETVRCVGKVVRVQPGGQAWETALEIVEIDPADSEKLLNFCLAEQFKQMQSRVRVMASFLSPSLEI